MRIRVLLVFTLLAAACSGGGATTTTTAGTTTTVDPGPTIPATTPTTGVVTPPLPDGPLVVWVETGTLAAAVEERADAFTAATGIAVEVEVWAPPQPAPPADGGGGAEIPADLREDLVAEGGDGVDIYLGSHLWTRDLVENGLAEPVGLPDGLPAAAVTAVTMRDHAYAVPLAVDGVVQVRNRALMPEAPAAVEAITCPEVDDCLLLPADGLVAVHHPFLAALGGYLYGPDPVRGFADDDLGVGTEEAIAGAEIFAALVADGTIDRSADLDAVVERFVGGAAALAWVPTGSLPAMAASGMDLSIETLPTIGGAPAVPLVSVLAAYVNPFGDAKSEAVAFATWLGDASGSSLIAGAAGMTPVWGDNATDAQTTMLASIATGVPVPFVDAITVAIEETADAFRRMHEGTTAPSAMTGAEADIRTRS